MVFEHRGEHESQWASIRSVAAKFGGEAQTLRRWVRRHERDHGLRPVVTRAEQGRLKPLWRENRERREASAYFSQLGAPPTCSPPS